MSSQWPCAPRRQYGRRSAGGSQWANGSSACGSIGKERAGVWTNQPRATRRSSAANAARRSRGTCSITLDEYARSNWPSAKGRRSVASAWTNGPG